MKCWFLKILCSNNKNQDRYGSGKVKAVALKFFWWCTPPMYSLQACIEKTCPALNFFAHFYLIPEENQDHGHFAHFFSSKNKFPGTNRKVSSRAFRKCAFHCRVSNRSRDIFEKPKKSGLFWTCTAPASICIIFLHTACVNSVGGCIRSKMSPHDAYWVVGFMS